jgi:hypothetical protein
VKGRSTREGVAGKGGNMGGRTRREYSKSVEGPHRGMDSAIQGVTVVIAFSKVMLAEEMRLRTRQRSEYASFES